MIKKQLELLTELLECSIKLSKNTGIDYLEYHPIGFADMIANLDNPCSIADVLDVVKQFVDFEINMIIEEENE